MGKMIKWDKNRFPTRFDVKYPYQSAMRTAFMEQANDAYGRVADNIQEFKVGFEVEYSVVDSNLDLAPQAVRDEAINYFNDESRVGYEVGASQIEIPTAPINLLTHDGMIVLEQLMVQEGDLARYFEKNGYKLLRSGTYPLVDLRNVERTLSVHKKKYRLCPEFHNRNQRPGLEHFLVGSDGSVDIGEAGLPGITNSVQITTDCQKVSEAVQILNRSLSLSPIMTLMGANAGYLGFADTGCADVRYIAWRVSHDLRTWDEVELGLGERVGLPRAYYHDISDYFNDVISQPFFMEDTEHALLMGIGTHWRDARLKLLEPLGRVGGATKPVVEFRPISVQPTVEQDFSVLMLYLGLLVDGEATNQPLLPMHLVRANKELVMRVGRAAELWAMDSHGNIELMLATDLLKRELERGLQGLRRLPTCDHVAHYIELHLRGRLTPAKAMEFSFGHIYGLPVERMRSAVNFLRSSSAGIEQAIRGAIVEMKPFAHPTDTTSHGY
jgi:gamma-glutamylcysteine synthetase